MHFVAASSPKFFRICRDTSPPCRLSLPGILTLTCRSSRPLRQVKVKIPGNDNRHGGLVSLHILKNFSELTATKCILASAFEVHVVQNQLRFQPGDVAD